MGNLDPRNTTEFLLQENNRLVTNLISASGGGSATNSATSTVASISNAAVQLLAANGNRVEAVVFNDSTANLYLKLGTGATQSDFTLILKPQEALVVDKYSGDIYGIWSATNGNARLTETS